MAVVTLIGNRALDNAATGGRTATVGEPSAGASGDQLFATGNWYASSSTDGGAHWTLLDPFNFLQPAAASAFCCDQVVLHDRARGIWIWILQYSRDPLGQNVFRLAFTHDSDFPRGWRFWEVGPTAVNRNWNKLWFDYPDAALSGDNLYVSFNVFDNGLPRASWQHAAVMRFPLETIAAGGALSMQSWTTDALGSLRLTQGARNKMYWAGHASPTRLRVFSWADGATEIRSSDVTVGPTSQTVSSIAPNGVDWLSRADWRITGGAVANGTITLMWTSGKDGSHPHPYCRAARINEESMQLVDEPDLWSDNHAWAYPAVAPNSGGKLGFTAFYGGGGDNPSHVVGVRDDPAGAWSGVFAKRGGNSPAEAKWGDYLSCRSTSDTWVATGYTLEGGESQNFIQPRVVQFR
jgi:hypothetical protein